MSHQGAVRAPRMELPVGTSPALLVWNAEDEPGGEWCVCIGQPRGSSWGDGTSFIGEARCTTHTRVVCVSVCVCLLKC